MRWHRSAGTRKRWPGSWSKCTRAAARCRSRDVPRKRVLPAPANGSNLPLMVGAVIYVRVSTKEQTENLSLPTQLRACDRGLPAPGLRGHRTFSRGRREREDDGPQPAAAAAHVLPSEQGPRSLRRGLQSDALRARPAFALRATARQARTITSRSAPSCSRSASHCGPPRNRSTTRPPEN